MQVNLPLYPVGSRFALADPGTTNYIFSGGANPTGFTPKEHTVTVRVTVNLATAGKLYVGMRSGSTNIEGVLNADTALTAATWYTFTFEARAAATYDFRLGTAGIVRALFVSEVGGGIS